MEEADTEVWLTAWREAIEEISLPQDVPMMILGMLPPFLSYTLLYVVPVIFFVTHTNAKAEVIDRLQANPDEVSAIFTARLGGFLGDKGGYTHTHHDVPWLDDKPFRLHAYRDESFASPVTGLTADIMLSVAHIAAGTDVELGFERMAPGQLSWPDLVQHVLDGKDAKARAK